MRLSARLAGAKLTLLSGPGATRGTTSRKRFFLRDPHGYILCVYPAGSWSILTSALTENPSSWAVKTEHRQTMFLTEFRWRHDLASRATGQIPFPDTSEPISAPSDLRRAKRG